MAQQKNMYSLSVKQWNPFVGCNFDCSYCFTSFRRQAKRQKHNCMRCYNFKPHTHPNRLDMSLPRTKAGEFIFTCSNADISFCPTPFLKKILAVMELPKNQGKQFLLQSKNPATFKRITQYPDNLILGVTLETNREGKEYTVSKAPRVSKRVRDMLKVKHPNKMVTIEPVLDFDQRELVSWVKKINPAVVWLGYNSGKVDLPEPSAEKFKKLHQALKKAGHKVVIKTGKTKKK